MASDPLSTVLGVFVGWLVLGAAFAAGAPMAARSSWAGVFRGTWLVVVAGVFAAGVAFVVRDPYEVGLRLDYILLVLSLLVVLPSGAAAWTASNRAHREEPGPVFVDILLSTFTFLSVFGLGIIAALIPDLMSYVGVLG